MTDDVTALVERLLKQCTDGCQYEDPSFWCAYCQAREIIAQNTRALAAKDAEIAALTRERAEAPEVFVDDDGVVVIDFDRANDDVVSLTIDEHGMGWSAYVLGWHSYGRISGRIPQGVVRALEARRTVRETP